MQPSRSQINQSTQKVNLGSFYSLGFFLIPATLASISGIAVLTFLLWKSFARARRAYNRQLSRANCLVNIADILNGTGLPIREKMKRVGGLLADEGDLAGWRCRIVLEKDPAFLPPSGNSLGVHIPLMAGDLSVGTLIVSSPHSKMDDVDQNFFGSLARSLAFFIHKEHMWDDFHSEVERLQANLLLNNIATPQDFSAREHPTVEHMLRMLGHLKGKVEISADNKL